MNAKDKIDISAKDQLNILNENAKKRFLEKEESIDNLSKALFNYMFRNISIGAIYADDLTQCDIKTLNQFYANRIAGILQLILNNNWLTLDVLYDFFVDFGSVKLDKVEPDIDSYVTRMISKLREKTFPL